MADQAGEPKLAPERISAAFAAQRAPSTLPKKFFQTAHVQARDQAYALLLDERPAKTPGRRELALPTDAAAQALADEWNRLEAVIDPAVMPLTRIVNTAIDGVAAQMDGVAAETVKYIGSDLLLYRAGQPEQLVVAEAARWDPVLEWCRETYGACFILVEGLIHEPQLPATLATMREALLAAVGDGAGAPFRLAALNVMTTLTGSALLALAVMSHALTPEDAWEAAHIDETFQESRWGQDAEALARREARWLEMQAAARLAALV